jgi:CheY-like chemotaxis protein
LERYQDRAAFPLPDLVLLDMKIPGLGDADFIKLVRQHPNLWWLRVVVLSGSSDPQDIEAAFAAGASSYLGKPFCFEELNDLGKTLTSTWFAPAAPERGPSSGRTTSAAPGDSRAAPHP